MSNKKLYLLLGIFAVIFTFFGGSLAYWQWNTAEEQQTMVTFSTTADFSCAVDGGGDITNNDVDLAPADCTNEKYAIKRTVKVMPTLNTDKTNVTMDLWLDIESIGTGLSASQNFRYALTTDADSCKTGVVESGTFTGKSVNQKVEIMNDKIYSQTYTDTYYLYVWLDKEETSESTMDQEFSLSLNGSCTNSSKGEPYYVVYSEDDTSLRFYKEEEGVIVEGEQYEGRTATNVYRAYENDVYTSESVRPWDGVKTLTTKIVIEDEIFPISTAYWFGSFTKVSNVDVTKLNTSNTIDMNRMFYRVGYNTLVKNFLIVGMENWDTSNVKNMRSIFQGVGYYAIEWNIGDLSEWDVSKVIDMYAMFDRSGIYATEWDIGDLSGWDVRNVTNMHIMFEAAGLNSEVWDIGNLDNWDVSNVIDMKYMFNFINPDTSSCSDKITTYNIGDLSNWDVSNVINMYGLFQCAGYSAKEFNIGNLYSWDVSKVEDMGHMFFKTGYSAQEFDIGSLDNWYVSQVKDMSYMFKNAGYNAKEFNIGDLSGWDVSNVTNMRLIFSEFGYSAREFDIGDLSNWDVGNVRDMYGMFSIAGFSAEEFNIGNIGKWDVSNVSNMSYMFQKAGYNVETFNINLSNWDVSNVEKMIGMFDRTGYNATVFNIGYLDNWDVSSVENMKYMFYNTGYTATDWSQDLSGWSVPLVTTYTGFNLGVGDKVIAPVWVNENVDTEE